MTFCHDNLRVGWYSLSLLFVRPSPSSPAASRPAASSSDSVQFPFASYSFGFIFLVLLIFNLSLWLRVQSVILGWQAFPSKRVSALALTPGAVWPAPLRCGFLLRKVVTIKPPGQVVVPVKCHKACEVPGSQGLLSKCCNFPLLSCPYNLNSPLLPLLKELKKAFENDYTIANIVAYRLIFQKSVKHFARGFSLSSLVLTVIYLKLLNQCILVCMCDYN